jgi:hypothetical protein
MRDIVVTAAKRPRLGAPATMLGLAVEDPINGYQDAVSHAAIIVILWSFEKATPVISSGLGHPAYR